MGKIPARAQQRSQGILECLPPNDATMRFARKSEVGVGASFASMSGAQRRSGIFVPEMRRIAKIRALDYLEIRPPCIRSYSWFRFSF